jgi:hypothetical protein
MSKLAILLLITFLMLSSLAIVDSAFAQSVPEFTMKFEAHPYDVPTTYGVDQYTGKNITIEEGYHVRNETIIFTIKNQHFSTLFYNIRYKGHFGDDWTEYYSHYDYASGDLVPQSNSGYTVITIPAFYPFVNGAEIDFQVQAVLYQYVEVFVSDHTFAPNLGGHYEDRFTFSGTSGWSKTQTMTFPAILPNVTVLLPQNANFNTSSVQLDFTVDQSVSQIAYSLDGGANVTVAGNTTLTGLPNGYHNITIYAMNEAGNTGTSETTYFNVDVPEPFPSWLIVAVIITFVAVVVVSLSVYFKKRKH